MTKQDAERHVAQLAHELGAQLIFDARLSDYDVSANTMTKKVYLQPWDHSRDWRGMYWTALHELGHIADNPPPKNELLYLLGLETDTIEIEARAWVWALDNSIDVKDNGVTMAMVALGSYTDGQSIWPDVGPGIREIVKDAASVRFNDQIAKDTAPPGVLMRWRGGWNRLADLAHAA